MGKAGHPLRKVRVNFEPDVWHGRASETLWAEGIGDGKYRIRNTPFFAKGIGFLDVIKTKEDDEGLIYVSTVLFSGHSTYRLSLLQPNNPSQFENCWKALQALGCTYESGAPEVNLLAVDVPPSADIHAVYGVLESGESDQVWEFEEGHCAHSV
jgi:hypothetical protein